MTESVFGATYADQYDVLYGEKNYDDECTWLERIFSQHSSHGRVESVLDLGCGTGNHAIRLAARGYQVTGVDLSPAMLDHACSKAQRQFANTAKSPITFVQGNVRDVTLDRQFDAAIMMFAVLGYQLTNEDVLATLHNVRRHLKPGGLFVCDFWYGPAVLNIRPSDRVRVIPMAGERLLRVATGSLDVYRQQVAVGFHLWRLNDRQIIGETEEVHHMRYFFPQEIALFMSQAGLSLLDMRNFDNPDLPPDEKGWDALAVAQAPLEG